MLSDEEKNRMAVMVVIFGAYAVAKRCLDRPSIGDKDDERRNVLRRMYKESDTYCHEQLRMNRVTFRVLCDRLQHHGLVNRRSVKIKEQVAMFLLIIGHDLSNRRGQFTFLRSAQTISRYFHTVLRAVISMYKEVIKPAKQTNSPNDGGRNHTWFHHFKDSVGAIDGTYIHANVPLSAQSKYRNRRGQIMQNVLVACTFDMSFTYVLAGWEGSAHDGRLLRDVVRPNRVDRLVVPLGKYYLADAGFPNVPGFLTPFRGVRYHLSDHRGRVPRNAKELFNYRHSSLRNVVERTIGLLKKRFKYLRSSPFFDIKTQTRVILACCVVHNYIRGFDPADTCENEVDPVEVDEHDDAPIEEENIVFSTSSVWAAKRENIANDMWEEFCRHRRS